MNDALSSKYSNLLKKKILITGHTGFKGGWLSVLLDQLDCQIYGLSHNPTENKKLYFGLKDKVDYDAEFFCDVANYSEVEECINDVRPDVIFHLAAQPVVSDGYTQPVKTMSSNVIGTLNILEALRRAQFDCSAIIVTSDKCYRNDDSVWGYREIDPLGGHDPYSASKAAAEIIASSYSNSYFHNDAITKWQKRVATVRAGNVIGGGDFTKNRIVVDTCSALASKNEIQLRNPHAIRPWQHVLETVTGYAQLANALVLDSDDKYSGAWNFGPYSTSNQTVKYLVEKMVSEWGSAIEVSSDTSSSYHEADTLKLSIDKAQSLLGWSPTWDLDFTLNRVVNWYKEYAEPNTDVHDLCMADIDLFFS